MCFLPTHLRAALVAAAAVATLAFAAPAQANPGDLDSTFGSGGVVLSNLDTVKGSVIEDVVVQPDGRIVALERGYSHPIHLLRYLPDGTLDPSFDGDAIALLPADVYAGDIALQADGRILASAFDLSGGFVVARFLPNGAIDQDFDGDSGSANGVVHAQLTQGNDLATSLAVDGQGRIVLAGHAGTAPGTTDAGLDGACQLLTRANWSLRPPATANADHSHGEPHLAVEGGGHEVRALRRGRLLWTVITASVATRRIVLTSLQGPD